MRIGRWTVLLGLFVGFVAGVVVGARGYDPPITYRSPEATKRLGPKAAIVTTEGECLVKAYGPGRYHYTVWVDYGQPGVVLIPQ